MKPVRSGVSQSTGNAWMTQDFVIDYFWWPNQTVASKAIFSLFGEDKIKAAQLEVNKEVVVRFHIELREWNGRQFNEVRCDGVRAANEKPATKTTPKTEAPANGGADVKGHADDGNGSGPVDWVGMEKPGQAADSGDGNGEADDLPF